MANAFRGLYRTDPVTELVAQKIVQIAQTGERDANGDIGHADGGRVLGRCPPLGARLHHHVDKSADLSR